jgi:outer membrane protein
MNRYFALGCLGLATSAVPAPKIGIIDLDNTLSTTPAGKRANDAFEKTRKGKQSELDKKQGELKRAEADLQKQKAVLKPEVFESKRQELEKKFVELQQVYVKLERDLAGERTKLIQDLLKQAGPKIEKIAKAEGVNLIIDREAVVYADPSVDLTSKLNAEMK